MRSLYIWTWKRGQEIFSFENFPFIDWQSVHVSSNKSIIVKIHFPDMILSTAIRWNTWSDYDIITALSHWYRVWVLGVWGHAFLFGISRVSLKSFNWLPWRWLMMRGKYYNMFPGWDQYLVSCPRLSLVGGYSTTHPRLVGLASASPPAGRGCCHPDLSPASQPPASV